MSRPTFKTSDQQTQPIAAVTVRFLDLRKKPTRAVRVGVWIASKINQEVPSGGGGLEFFFFLLGVLKCQNNSYFINGFSVLFVVSEWVL